MKTTNSSGDSLFWICFSVFVVLLICGSAFSAEKNMEDSRGEVGQVLIFKTTYYDNDGNVKNIAYFALEQKETYPLLRYLNQEEKDKLHIIIADERLKEWLWINKIGEQK